MQTFDNAVPLNSVITHEHVRAHFDDMEADSLMVYSKDDVLMTLKNILDSLVSDLRISREKGWYVDVMSIGSAIADVGQELDAVSKSTVHYFYTVS